MKEKLEERIKMSKNIKYNVSFPESQLLENQVVIMETLIELIEEIKRIPKKRGSGMGPR